MDNPYTLPQMIEAWKDEYKQVFTVHINGFDFYFRLLTYNEYALLGSIADNAEELDEYIAKTCVLDPIVEDWEEGIWAGYVTSVALAIKEESLIKEKPNGENNIRNIIENEQNELDSKLIRQIPPLIAHTFPAYTVADVKAMSLKEQAELYAEALWVLETVKGVVFEFAENEEHH